jgi:hypothetical protein
MHWLKRVLVVMAFAASTAGHAEPTKPLDVATLDAAEKLWSHASLRNYKFTFQYHEFVSPCGSWEFDVRVSRGVPEHRGDCRKYRTEFSSVPLLFKYLRHALKRVHHLVEAEFDPTLGYPVSAFVAWSATDDDFFSFEVVNFVTTQQPLR